ncbi:CRISPR system precrRNA processing endoribonuclease RAMP protein Cas6 [bacterium]|nr:CRISPR system precrRNA processing endoribonuclease RAMP protein Cas6 [bacterium]MBU1956912.1 CRISPR system precrRNA processing endoribonuclease RAMP protein Cas6 [bacterium]
MNHHHIKIETQTKKNHSYFTGSMFRGALGYALKKVVCINPSYMCDNCFAKNNCLFYAFYEEKNVAHNYRLDIELGKKDYSFGLYLFSDACTKLPYVLSAIHQMFTEQGLGRDKAKISDFTIKVDGEEIYDGKEFRKFDFIEQNSKAPQLDNFCPNIKIKLKTPLRIKKSNRFLRDDVDIEDILRSIYQREQEIFYGNKVYKLEYKPSYLTILKMLKYQELIRKSNRQKTKMNMDGVVGEIAVMGIDEQSYRLLKLGEIIGVGKQTVMGLGRIEVEDI